VVVQYHAGPRKLPELQAFLTPAGHLFSRQGWHKLLGDQRLLSPSRRKKCSTVLYGAVLLPHDVFAHPSVSQVIDEAHAVT
jgi:hypothetical protein